MKTSGDKGNLGGQEREIFLGTAKRIIPDINLISAFSPEAKKTAIFRAELALTDLIYMLGIVDDPSQKEETVRRLERIKDSVAIIDNLSAEHEESVRAKESDEEEKSKNASRMGAAGQWGWGSRI
jgi:hypothetical protein